ncbi:MAG: PDZ domain-containing protein, partial [Acidobacteriota bacterium]|nr:PDZ domain-containing protein [Acidobacteriota bacterium]
SFDVTLGERDPVGEVAFEETETEGELEWLGLQYQNVTPGMRESQGLPEDIEGVVVTDVAATSPLIDEGVGPGAIITEVNGERVRGTAEFEAAVESVGSGSFLRLYVQRFAARGDERIEQGSFAIVRVP